MDSFRIEIPATVKPEAVLLVLMNAVRNIPVASKLVFEHSQRIGFGLTEEDARRAVLLMRAWTAEAYFARASGTPSNTITADVVQR